MPRAGLKRSKKSKKPIKSKRRGMQSLNKKIASIRKVLPRPNRLYYGYRQTTLLDISPEPYNAYNIMKFSNWQRIFGTNTEDELTRSAKFNSATIQHYISSDGLTEPMAVQQVIMTYFLVRLTKKGSYLLDEANGQLKTLTSNVHYYTTNNAGIGGLGGMTILNKEFFKIVKFKRFVLGNQLIASTQNSPNTQFGTDRQWTDKLSFRFDVTNPSGNWFDQQMPQSPQQNYFMILFNDNGNFFQRPRWNSSMVLTCDTY